MKWIVSALILAAGLLGVSDKTHAQPYPSYPFDINPCLQEGVEDGCIPEVQGFVWVVESKIPGQPLIVSANFEDVVQQTLEMVRTSKNCGDCIVITQDHIDEVSSFNRAVTEGTGLGSIGFRMFHEVGENPEITEKVTNYNRNVTNHDSDAPGRWIAIGKIENYYDFYDPDEYELKAIRYYQHENEKYHSYLFNAPYLQHHARLMALCENNEWAPSIQHPSFPWERIFYCVSTPPETPNDSMSGLDALTEGCAYGCNPVHLATGAKMDYKRDYQNYSPYPIVIDRWYHSSIGGWRFSFERQLVISPRLGGGARAILHRPDGMKVFFTQEANSSSWTAVHATHLGKFTENLSTPGTKYSYTNLNGETEIYNAEGQLVRTTNLEGQSIYYTYGTGAGAYNMVSQISDDFGRSISLSYINNNNNPYLSRISDHAGKVIQYSIQPKKYTTRESNVIDDVMYADNTIISYDYQLQNGKSLLTTIVGEDGNVQASYEYDNQNRVISSWKGSASAPNAQKNKISYSYSSQNTSVTSGGGTSDFYIDEATGKTSSRQNVCNGCSGDDSLSVSYASNGAWTSRFDKDGVVTLRHINPSNKGLPSNATMNYGTDQQHTVAYFWNVPTRQLTSVIEPVATATGTESRTTMMTYDANNRLWFRDVFVSDSSVERSEMWTYNAKGQVLTYKNPVSGTTTYSYSPTTHNLTSKTNSLGHVWTYSNYTFSGLAGRMIDPNGLYTEITYDQRDRVTQIRRGHPSDHWETVTFQYNDLGLLKKATSSDNEWIEYTYDDAHQVQSAKTIRGKTVYTRDIHGNVTEKKSYDASNQEIQKETYEYDVWQNLTKVIDAYNVQPTLMSYHSGTDRLNVITEGSRQTAQNYDAQGRHIGQTVNGSQPMGTASYNLSDQITQFIDPQNVSWGFQYNSFGDLVVEGSPDYSQWWPISYEYKNSGLLDQRKDGRGVVETYTYDGLGRPTQVVYDGSTATPVTSNETQQFAYDTCTFGVGRTCSITDSTGQTSYQYDRFGRTVTKTFTPAGAAFTHNTYYTYNNLGQMSSLTYPSGKRLDFEYLNGQVRTLEYDFQPVASNVTWNYGGKLGSWTALNGTNVTLTYDQRGYLETMNDLDYRYYINGRQGRKSVVLDAPPTSTYTITEHYSFDYFDNLQSATLDGRPAPIYTHHTANSNLRYKEVGPTSDDTYQLEFGTSNNRPESVTEGTNPSYTLDFDQSGNLIDNKKGLTLTYDSKNRMSGSNRMGIVATYGVNALGQRMRKSGSHLSTGHRYYAYDEESRLIGVYDGTGAAIEEFVYLYDYKVIAMARNIAGVSSITELYAVFPDHLGTPRKVTNATGTLLWSWENKDPYGHQAPNEFHTGTTFEFDLRFPGQIFDNETGLYHNGFRDYDPKRGAYVQPDPIGLAGGMNPYSYAGGDPVNFSDPTGLIIDTGADARTQRAINYLKQNSPTARRYIEEAEADPMTLQIIRFNDKHTNSHYDAEQRKWYEIWKDEYKQTVTWNEAVWLVCDTTDQVTATPEMGLFHEIMHFLQNEEKQNNLHNQIDSQMTPEDKARWGRSKERAIIEGPERMVGKELGLKAYRESHNIRWPGKPQRVEYRIAK